MTVYADVLVLTNLYLDFFLLWCVKAFLHLRPKKGRLVLGALAGGLSSLLSLATLSRPLLLLIGAVCALVTAAAAFAPLKLFLFFKSVLLFWLFSFLLAGFFLFLLTFFPVGNAAVVGNAIYLNFSPLFLFGATCVSYLFLSLLYRLFPKPTVGRFCRLRIEHGGKSVSLFCKADTGCSLREPFSGLPVIVGEVRTLREVAPPGMLDFLTGKTTQEPLRLIPFSTVGSNGLLPAFQADRVILEKTGEPLDCYIALCPKPLSAGEYDGLYNPDLFPSQTDFHLQGGTDL